MMKSTWIMLAAIACTPVPVPVPGPVTPGTGGAPSTGGSSATGGAACAPVAFPDTPSPASNARTARRHHMPKRHFRKPGRALPTPQVAHTCSVFDHYCDPPLNQGDTGSCTGNAADAALCSLGDAADYNETVARTIYENGTCIDNGCATPCTCASCPAAFCPDTNANDTGSNGSSVAQYLVNTGKIKAYTTADTIADLLSCLSTPGRAAIIGVTWYNSMFTPNSDGRIVVTASSGAVGGHQLFAAAYDAQRGGVWVHNSWGLWGQCFGTSKNSDGTGCGWGWISMDDLVTLQFDADCLARV